MEHKIKEAFESKESAASYPRKEELWNKIASAKQTNFGVSSLWRIAAVLLAVFFITGAFASGYILNKSNKKTRLIESRIAELKFEIDSMQNLPVEKITEVKYIEKEVRVEVPVIVSEAKSSEEMNELKILKAQNIILNNQLEIEKRYWKNFTDSIANESQASNNLNNSNEAQQKTKNEESVKIVVLKPERNNKVYQKKIQDTNPKMKLQFFSKPSRNVDFDLNTTLLKK